MKKNGTEFCAANLFVQNKSHRNIAITVEDMLAIDSFWGGGVAAGKCAFLAASWRNTAWREDGIEDVAEIKFRLRAYDNDNWLLQDLVNETVTLKPRNAWHSSDTV